MPVLLALPLAGAAQEASVQLPLQDPWVPPSVRKALPQAAARTPSQGAALQVEVEAKLRARFDAAVVDGSGTLTRDQARVAGLVLIADRFGEIDTARSGRVSFEDFKRYLRRQGADI
jgi:hypothetical protein